MSDATEEYWDLGGGSDCETCGWTLEEAEGEFQDGFVALRLRYGCYSGDYYEGSPGRVLDEFRDDWPTERRAAFDNPGAFDSIEKWLRGLILNLTSEESSRAPHGDGFVETR